MTRASCRCVSLGVIFLFVEPVAAQVTYFGGGGSIPNLNPAGANFEITVPDAFALSALTITLDFRAASGGMPHTWTGDLIATIQHVPSGAMADFFRRVQKFDAAIGFGNASDLAGPYTFTDAAGTLRLADTPSGTGTIAAGSYRATNNTFNGVGNPTFSGETIQNLNALFAGVTNVSGVWRLNIADVAGGQDLGSLGIWSLTLTPVPEPSSLLAVGILTATIGWRRIRNKTHRRSRIGIDGA